MQEACEGMDNRLFVKMCGQYEGASLAVLEGEM